MRMPSSAALVLAWLLVPVPVAAWIVAQSLPERIEQPDQFTGAYVHSLAASMYAVILMGSAVTNAIIVTVRYRDRPSSLGNTQYVPSQAMLILLALGWLACLIVGKGALPVELVLATVIIVASVVVFVFTLKRDPDSTARRRHRLAARSEARSPASARAVRIARIVVPALVVVGVVAAISIAQCTEASYLGCHISGKSQVSGSVSLYSDDCGTFSVPASVGSYNELSGFGTYDIVTRGFALTLPPQPVVVTLTPVGD